MAIETVTGILLILVPIAFNVAFFALGAAFEYPAILRKEPDEILRRFAAGGAGLILRWEALMLSALGMLPISVRSPCGRPGPGRLPDRNRCARRSTTPPGEHPGRVPRRTRRVRASQAVPRRASMPPPMRRMSRKTPGRNTSG